MLLQISHSGFVLLFLCISNISFSLENPEVLVKESGGVCRIQPSLFLSLNAKATF